MNDLLSQILGMDELANQSAYQANYQRNQPYVKAGANNYNTQLNPLNELVFRNWVEQNKVPFNPRTTTNDYDMRGFFQALQNKNPMAMTAVNPNDSQIHYPDYWKTPYHQTFSNQSQWAAPIAPQWNAQDQLVSPSARILFDERKQGAYR